MKNEWLYAGLAIAFAAVFFGLSSATVALTMGWLSLICGYIFLPLVIYLGWCAKLALRHNVGVRDAVLTHRVAVAIMTIMILVGVLGIEIAVRKSGGLWGDPWFVGFHLSLVACMSLTFILARFYHTGLKNPSQHRRLVYAFGIFFTATLITGTILILERFSELREPIRSARIYTT